MRNLMWVVMFVLWQVSTAARGDELSELRDRVAQLQATVEELTLQLADSVVERRRLEAQLAETVAAAGAAVAGPAASSAPAVVASSAEADARAEDAITETAVPSESARAAEAPTKATRVAVAASAYDSTTDCDVGEALAGYDGKRKGNEALEAWLQSDDHLTRCSTAQLQEIRKAVQWDWLGYQKPVLKLLDAELASR